MLSLNHISIQFGGRTLFDDVSLVIGPHDRIGLVGSNGTGKSTLLKIISGINQADSGTIGKARYVTVGYLPQDGVIASGKTLYKEVEQAFEDIMLVQDEMNEAHQLLSSFDPSSEEYHDTLEVYGELQHKLEDLDAFRMKSKIERVLMGLGFSVSDFNRQTEEFSGGWQMRIALAKLLLQEPSVLLLDEPTNHLDLESLQWLEEYLRNYNGAIILVSHDRAFLDSLIKKIIALSMGKLEVYSGNYSFYENEKSIRKEQQINAYKNQQRQLAQTERFIERFRYKATKARQVQSRVKQLEKIERIEIENDEEEIRFHFPSPQQSGNVVMDLKSICKNYGDLNVFENLNYTIERGDKIAIVGVNGSGKSTFVRILAGTEIIQKGERKIGHNVILSYFGQHQAEELDLSKEAIQIVDDVAVGEIRTKLRTILGSFLFHGDDVFKKVSVLSGGEKSRLALAKMLLHPANFLIMDEPTNHLDMRSKKVLQDALMEYEGTYVIVSHDRAFLDPIINKVIEFSPGNVRTFVGNVSDYLAKKKEERETATQQLHIPSASGGLSSQIDSKEIILSDKERKRIDADKRQKLFKLLLPLREKLEKIENVIGTMEKQKSSIETLMASPDFFSDGEQAKRLTREYKEVQISLEQAYLEWEEINLEIDRIRAKHQK
ncbi:MAG: ABC-F family ATP-binding cassette domain-containing protein [Bacteroidota bacterium]|nr:ABC-F family ATP-binding cassette domain-containing protein [Bacteroidota bacterium]